MSTVKGSAPRSIDQSYQDVPQQNVGAFSTAWRLLNEEPTMDTKTYGQLVQLYGDGLKMFDAWQWAGRYTTIDARKVKVIEEGTFLDTLDLAEAITVGAVGADISIVSLKGFGRVGFVVHVPAKYTGTDIAVSYRISAKSYAAGTGKYTYTAQALTGTEQITVEVPIGQKLIVGGSMFAPGTQQPAGLVEDFFEHDHYTRILKETINEEGGQQALGERAELSQSQFGSGLHGRNLVKAQLRLRQQVNDFFLMGYPATRTDLAAITQNNRWGEANVVTGDYGVLPGMVTLAMKQYYTGTYSEDNFDAIKFLMASQGVVGSSGLFLQGQQLGLSTENSGLKFIKEYSGGSDMYDKLSGIGFGIKEILKNGFKTYLAPIPEFSNPLLYAADNYNYETMGMIFPDSKVTAGLNGILPSGLATAGRKVSLSNVAIGYLSNNGEDRKLIVGNKAGVNGRGIPISDDWDDVSTYMLTEVMIFLLALNQTILVLRTDQ